MSHPLIARSSRLCALALALALGFGALAVAQQPQPRPPATRAEITLSFAPVVKRAAPAVVNVYALKRVQGSNNPFFDDPFFRRFFGDQFPGTGPPRGSDYFLRPRPFPIAS